MKRLSQIALLLGAILVPLGGCSVRFVPLDSPVEEAYPPVQAPDYAGYYPGPASGYPSELAYNAWWMSYYHPHADNRSGYLPPDRLSADPNPNDSYSAGEAPVKQVGPQRSTYSHTEPQSQQSTRRHMVRGSGNQEGDTAQKRSRNSGRSRAAQPSDEDAPQPQRDKIRGRTRQ